MTTGMRALMVAVENSRVTFLTWPMRTPWNVTGAPTSSPATDSLKNATAWSVLAEHASSAEEQDAGYRKTHCAQDEGADDAGLWHS